MLIGFQFVVAFVLIIRASNDSWWLLHCYALYNACLVGHNNAEDVKLCVEGA
jgi:hypothetical protein